MHPPLTLSKHPLCRQNVQNLQKCHAGNPWYEKWFLGKCNREKWELDECLKRQKIFKARENKEKGEKYKERLKERQQQHAFEKKKNQKKKRNE
jgi:COX assembly mitochondrial protein 2